MPAGRPRTHDRLAIVQQMIEWAEKEDSINLCGFCANIKLPPSLVLRWSKEDDEFGLSYEIVKARLGERREKMLSNDQLHVKAYDLNAKTYDPFLKEESRSHAEFESSLKAKEQTLVNEADIIRHEALLNQISSLRSERKIEDNNNKAEQKS